MKAKKLVALGVTAVSAASLSVGAVAPSAAHAVTLPSVGQQVCGSIPGIDANLQAALTQATNFLSTVGADLAAKQAALDRALSAYATSVVDLILAIDNHGDVLGAKSAMDARLTDLVNAGVAWSKALAGQFGAQQALSVLQLQQHLVSQITSGLDCGV
jgi:hypothetical protein